MQSLLFYFIMAAWCVTDAFTLCDDGWIFYEDDGTCLKFFAPQKTFARARQACAAEGGDLLTISDSAKNEFMTVHEELNRSQFWLGMWDENKDGNWSNVRGDKQVYTNWDEEEPNNWSGLEYCVVFSNTWFHDRCDSYVAFFCEKPALYIAEKIGYY